MSNRSIFFSNRVRFQTLKKRFFSEILFTKMWEEFRYSIKKKFLIFYNSLRKYKNRRKLLNFYPAFGYIFLHYFSFLRNPRIQSGSEFACTGTSRSMNPTLRDSGETHLLLAFSDVPTHSSPKKTRLIFSIKISMGSLLLVQGIPLNRLVVFLTASKLE